ncbi:MAG TPA: diguanylate cyclase [Steroidobacteraceae bacterium]|nr:diguanylate cyclase [Steroidobacteraceae bacterium]
MAPAARLIPGEFPDSPYAAELGRPAPHGRFGPQLEAEYLGIDLAHARVVVRATTACSCALALGHGAEQLSRHASSGALLVELGIIVAASLVLASCAWSRSFERLYPPVANVVVPLRSSVIALHLAQGVAQGQLAFLMWLPLMLVVPFFLLGLRLRPALCAGVLGGVTFIAAAGSCGLPPALLVRSAVFLTATLLGCAIVARQMESWSRMRFLESHLIAELAQRDALTGTKNRRVFGEHLARMWQQAAREHRRLAILVIDVDHFKAYNDRYGHLAGDEALRGVARTLQGFVQRPLDLLARYGGEEFAAILYDAAGCDAHGIAERMRCAVMELAIEHRGSRTAETVTVSIGVAAIEPTLERDCRGALQLADQALYEAKLRGRNACMLVEDEEYTRLATGVFSNTLFAGSPASEAPG